jgi:hypothetical protein
MKQKYYDYLIINKSIIYLQYVKNMVINLESELLSKNQTVSTKKLEPANKKIEPQRAFKSTRKRSVKPYNRNKNPDSEEMKNIGLRLIMKSSLHNINSLDQS